MTKHIEEPVKCNNCGEMLVYRYIDVEHECIVNVCYGCGERVWVEDFE